MRRTPRLVAPTLLAALLLTGCVTPDPAPTPPPTDAAPVFASDEEALAAAEEAYSAYVATTDQILQAGGNGEDALRPLVSDDVFDVQSEGFATFRDRNWHSVGSTVLTNVALQSWNHPDLTMYVCSDVSGVDVVDASGFSQVSPSRPTQTAYEAVMTWVEDRWIVASEEVWSGSGVC